MIPPSAAPALLNGGPGIAALLRAAVAEALPMLRSISEGDSQRRRQPTAWSPREIIGHLIDSASNNHGRFVRAALEDTLVFPPYDQEAWVALHEYHDQPWHGLLDRWTAFNEQIAGLIERIPRAALMRQRTTHNLHRIAWRTVPDGIATSLDYFVRDYIGHLRHHLAQIASTVDVDATVHPR